YYPSIFRSESYDTEAKSLFADVTKKQFEPIERALDDSYRRFDYLHPVNDPSLRSILATHGIDFDSVRDPWGMTYKAEFSVQRERDVVTIVSAGPDKKFDTADDFTAFSGGFEYFTPMGKAVDTAVRNYNARTGDVIRDDKTLFNELGIHE